MRIARVIAIVAVVLMVAGLVLGCGNKHYSLTIAVNGQGGTTAPAPGTYTYKDAEVVTVTATPDTGWEFDSLIAGAVVRQAPVPPSASP
jgi:uncharacterized lipoprotein YehR (DUF1307 family)